MNLCKFSLQMRSTFLVSALLDKQTKVEMVVFMLVPLWKGWYQKSADCAVKYDRYLLSVTDET